MALDLREMSFQNVLDTILKPAGVKVGGFPEELFTDLKDDEKEKWICNICFLLVKDTRQCDNKHLFCHTCVFAWTMTYGENSQKCPMCRCQQRDYKPNADIDKALQDKRVKCQEEGCTFKAPLKVFLMHSHGRTKYSNAHVDLDSLRPPRPSGSRLLVLPANLAEGFVGLPSGSRPERAAHIRSQLQQGRAMIHQMMMLLHLEMQLRQQALVSYQEARDPVARLHRLDEVLALNEQLNEVGSILATLLNSPMNSSLLQGLENRDDTPTPSARSPTPPAIPSRLSLLGGPLNHPDPDSDSESSADTEADMRTDYFRRSVSRDTSLGGSTSQGTTALERARRRSDIRQELLTVNTARTASSTIGMTSSSTAVPGSSSTLAARTPRSLMERRQDSSLTRPSISTSIIGSNRDANPTGLSRARDTTTTTESVRRFNVGGANPETPHGTPRLNTNIAATAAGSAVSLPQISTGGSSPRAPVSSTAQTARGTGGVNTNQAAATSSSVAQANSVARSITRPIPAPRTNVPRGPGVPATPDTPSEGSEGPETDALPQGSSAHRRVMDGLGGTTPRPPPRSGPAMADSSNQRAPERLPADPAASTNAGVFSVVSQRPLGTRTPAPPPVVATPPVASPVRENTVTTTQLYDSPPSVPIPETRSHTPARLTSRATAPTRSLTNRGQASPARGASTNRSTRSISQSRTGVQTRSSTGSTSGLSTLPRMSTQRSTGSRASNASTSTSRAPNGASTQRRPAAGTGANAGNNAGFERPRRRSEIQQELLKSRQNNNS